MQNKTKGVYQTYRKNEFACSKRKENEMRHESIGAVHTHTHTHM